MKDQDNHITQYTYDESDYNRGMLLSKTIGETTISYEYDNWLNYSEINDGGQITSYTYTGNNKLKSKTTPDNKTISYEYDGAGNLKTVTDYAGQTTTYSYNRANQLLKATGGGVTQSYTYETNGSGRLIKITTGTAKQEYTYNNLGEVTSMVRTIGGAAKTYDYTYDNNGNILQEKENNVVQNTYTYDELNQLLTATDKNGTKTTYEYDANNNVSSKTIDHSAADTYILTNAEISTEFTNITEHKQTMSYQNGNQLKDIDETVTGISNGTEISKTVSTIYSYTNGGKLNTIIEMDGGEQLYRTFNYNERNQMINHYYDFTLKATYSYDAEGYRSSKTVDGVTTKYYWDRGYTCNESDGTNFTAKNTIGIGGMIARKTGSQTPIYLMKDVHGDTTALLQNDSQVGTYEYDEYGNLNGSTGAADNPYRYCGEYFDEETGFIYLRNRYYDPKIGRFTSEDPAKSGINWYVYCENNPLKFVDPWGLDAIIITNSNSVGIEGVATAGHTSAIYQNANGSWYYTYWGNNAAAVIYIPDEYMNSLEHFNEGLNNILNHYGYSDITSNYTHATYIVGDFTASLQAAYDDVDSAHHNQFSEGQHYFDETNGNFVYQGQNSPYNVLYNNCFDRTYASLSKGTLADGTNVGNYMKDLGFKGGMIPNNAIPKFNEVFVSDSFTYWNTYASLLNYANLYDQNSPWAQKWKKANYAKSVTGR